MNVEFLQSQFVCLLHFIEESVDHAPRASPRPNPRERRVTRRAPVASEGFPRRAPTRPQPPWFSASRARAAPAAVIFRARRFAASQSAGAPRRQTRAGRLERFPTPCAHAATTAAFFRTPRRVGRRAPVASEGLPRRAPTRPQPPWVSAPALRRDSIRESAASADARRSLRKVSRVARPRGTSRRDLPRPALRRVPIRESAASPDARRSVQKVFRVAYPCVHSRRVLPHPALRRQTHAGWFGGFTRVARPRGHSRRGFPRRAPTRPQPPWFSASRTRAAPAAVIFRAPRFAASQSAGAPRCQTRVGRFERVPASRTHASTAAAFFRTPRFAASADARRSVRKVFRVARPRVHSRHGFPRSTLRRVPIRGSAASPDARRLVRRVYPRHAPARRRASAASAAAICACCLL